MSTFLYLAILTSAPAVSPAEALKAAQAEYVVARDTVSEMSQALKEAQDKLAIQKALLDAMSNYKPARPTAPENPSGPCECPGGGECTCPECEGAGTCRCLNCTCAYTDYKKAYAAAVKANKPLVLWIGVVDSENQVRHVPGAFHCRLYSFQTITEGIVISRPDGMGGMEWKSTLPASSSVRDVRNALEAARERAVPQPVPQPVQHLDRYQYPYQYQQPVSFTPAPRMVPMFRMSRGGGGSC